ncbi:MAG: tRNA (N6-isopentenyl adenosine(37)-C2)-methylthiotransferase MiaB [Flammeovirgaceae bacterium]|nr:tRNA (N6-isopentenyl adenosine(37)-C2)-methylthiotransferase MiaB [Flammeovirgaceae bacterium]|tara:strand:- start:2111 stop:3478 length:1368 start_codon:yes stop_codon:yes gene_type:complete
MSKSLYIQSYGCAMNFSDSEIVASILKKEGYNLSNKIETADLVLINTCSIREKAEETVRKRLETINIHKKGKPDMVIGILGCMAERLKEKLLNEEKVVDIVAGPDSYRDLPNLVRSVIDKNEKSVNTILSLEETYENIEPVRINSNGISAFISIMRGCDNMCSFCVVPYTRGRERSRNPDSIIKEAINLYKKGYREVTLLGQNVDSFKWSPTQNNKIKLEKESKSEEITYFSDLLEMTAKVSPDLRIRFSTSHPKDITIDVLKVIRKYENVCNYIHLPAQSGNSRILKKMNRTYDREWYLNKIKDIKSIVGDTCAISSDFIAGFCSENEDEHMDTLSLMDNVLYDYSYMYYYSDRPGTLANKKYDDDVPLEIKKKRLSDIVKKQNKHSLIRNESKIDKHYKILVEGYSKKSDEFLRGKTSENKMVVFRKKNNLIGKYVDVKINECNSATLFGELC